MKKQRLINKDRIDEAKRNLFNPDKQHLTIIDIAYEVGFNSKSAFNTAFKKSTNMTPSQYKLTRLDTSVAA
jgi:AraC-like DNA-binding protein